MEDHRLDSLEIAKKRDSKVMITEEAHVIKRVHGGIYA